MTPDSDHPLRHRQTYDHWDSSGIYYGQKLSWDSLSQPSVILPALLLLLTFVCHSYYGLASTGTRQTAPLSKRVWDGAVYLIPGSLLFAIDRWLNPPLFPVSMLQSQTRTHASKSDVLKKLLGLDRPGGIMMSVSQASRLSLPNLSSSVLGLKGQSDRPAGLGNWDNSCYQNSILQGLASLRPLPRYLAGPALEAEDGSTKGHTADTLRDLIDELNDSANNGKTLWTPGILKNMSTWQQQDAQEYFSKLLDEIDKDIAKAVRASQRSAGFETDCARDDSDVSQHSDDSGYQSLYNSSKASLEPNFGGNPLEGLIAQRVACVSCGYSEGLSMIPFNCITLNLGIDSSQYDLYERLDSYTRVESIQGVECPKCTLLKFQRLVKIILERSRAAGVPDADLSAPLERLRVIEEALEDDAFDDRTLSAVCKVPAGQRVASTKTKQAVIARAPRSLVVHMNRSVFDESTGRMFKNLAAVRFPQTLDLGPWCLGSAAKSTATTASTAATAAAPSASSVSGEEEQWLLEPTSSMVAGDLHPSKITGPIYELRAVITHYGRHENGHYVCYRRHPRHQGGNAAAAEDDDNEVGDEMKSDRPPRLAGDKEAGHQGGAQEVDAPGGEALAADLRETSGDPASREARDNGDDDGDWWRLSDQDVTRSSEEAVLAQGGVFMLFYDCVDGQSALISEGGAEEEFVDAQATLQRQEGLDGTADERDVTESRSYGPRPAAPQGREEQVQPSSDVMQEALRRAVDVPLPPETDETEPVS